VRLDVDNNLGHRSYGGKGRGDVQGKLVRARYQRAASCSRCQEQQQDRRHERACALWTLILLVDQPTYANPLQSKGCPAAVIPGIRLAPVPAPSGVRGGGG